MKYFWGRFFFFFFLCVFVTGLVVVKYVRNAESTYLSEKANLYYLHLSPLIFVENDKVSLKEMANLQNVVKKIVDYDHDFKEFVLFSKAGKIVYSNYLGLIGDNVPIKWKEVIESGKSYFFDEDRHFYFYPYESGSQNEGYVLAVYLRHVHGPIGFEKGKNNISFIFGTLSIIGVFGFAVHYFLTKRFMSFLQRQDLYLSADYHKDGSDIDLDLKRVKEKISAAQNHIQLREKELENYEDFQ